MASDDEEGGFWTGTRKTIAAIAAAVTACTALLTALTSAGLIGPMATSASPSATQHAETSTSTVTTDEGPTSAPGGRPTESSGPTPTDATTSPTTSTTTTTTSTTVPPSDTGRTDIGLAYTDPYGCAVDLAVQVGDQLGRTVQTSGEVITLAEVPVGTQPYEIGAHLSCPTLGDCDASGSGQVEVVEGVTFDLVWSVVDVGTCRIDLV